MCNEIRENYFWKLDIINSMPDCIFQFIANKGVPTDY